MNILFLLKTFDLGGVEIVSATLAKQFKKTGHQVTIFAFEKGKGTALNNFKDLYIEIGYGYSFKKGNIVKLREIIELKKIQIVINQWGLPFLPIRTIIHAIKGLEPKIISIHHNDPFSNGLLKRIEAKLDRATSPITKPLLKIIWHFFKYITSYSMCYVYNHSTYYMVLSPSYIEHFKSFTGIKNPQKLLVQTNPITLSCANFTFDAKKKEKEIIYVGRIDNNQKRVYRVIETWALLENKYTDWRLTIVGDGCERKNVEKQAKDLELKRVSFEGFQAPKEYYKRASILLLTSEYEGFPLVIAECMSFGVIPAVYGSYSAVYDIIDDNINGIIIPYNKIGYKAQEMANKLVKVMSSSILYERMACAAIKKSKLYSIDIIGKSWNKLFKEIT